MPDIKPIDENEPVLNYEEFENFDNDGYPTEEYLKWIKNFDITKNKIDSYRTGTKNKISKVRIIIHNKQLDISSLSFSAVSLSIKLS